METVKGRLCGWNLRWNLEGCRNVCLVIAVGMIVTSFSWLSLNIVLIAQHGLPSSNDALVTVQQVYQALGFLTILVGETNLKCYPTSVLLICIVQCIFPGYLLIGIIKKSFHKLWIWFVYEGLVMGVSILYFAQLWSRPRDLDHDLDFELKFKNTNRTDLELKSEAATFETTAMNSNLPPFFWTTFIGRIALFLIFNGIYIYAINSLREKIESKIVESASVAIVTTLVEEDGSEDAPEDLNLGGSSGEVQITNEMRVIFVSILNFAFYSFKVLVSSIYLLCLTFVDYVTTKMTEVDTMVYLVIGILGLCFTFVLWRGNAVADNTKLLVFMGFQLTSSIFLYACLMYWTVTGLAFDFVVLKFTLIYLIAVTSLQIVSKRTYEIGYALDYRNINPYSNLEGVEDLDWDYENRYGNESDMVQLVDLSKNQRQN